jgi:hypothetical protein
MRRATMTDSNDMEVGVRPDNMDRCESDREFESLLRWAFESQSVEVERDEDDSDGWN